MVIAKNILISNARNQYHGLSGYHSVPSRLTETPTCCMCPALVSSCLWSVLITSWTSCYRSLLVSSTRWGTHPSHSWETSSTDFPLSPRYLSVKLLQAQYEVKIWTCMRFPFTITFDEFVIHYNV